MVFALEPKLVYRNEFAAGIESVFRVTENAGRLVSKVPVEIFICQLRFTAGRKENQLTPEP